MISWREDEETRVFPATIVRVSLFDIRSSSIYIGWRRFVVVDYSDDSLPDSNIFCSDDEVKSTLLLIWQIMDPHYFRKSSH